MATNDPRKLLPSFRDFSSWDKFELDSEGNICFVESTENQSTPPTVHEVMAALEADPNALETEGWPRLEESAEIAEKIPGLVVHSYGGFAPFQADGVWGPYEWYYRERGGASSLGLAPIGTFPSATDALYWASGEAEEFKGSDGWIDRFLDHWVRLAPGPDGYWFEVNRVKPYRAEDGSMLFDVLEGEREEIFGWGNSAEEALEYTSKPSPYLEEHGWSEDFQRKIWIAQGPTVECARLAAVRIYPTEHPSFEVRGESSL